MQLTWIRALLLAAASALLAPSLQAAEGPTTFKAGEFTFQRPSDWAWVETASSMRKAQLKITGQDAKQIGEVVFFFFGEGGGGGTQANIDRWLGQFEQPKAELHSKVEEVTVNKRKVTYVRVEGTYLSGMPGGPKTPQPNSTLIGAILESEQGNVFVRLTGPAPLARAADESFRKMVSGSLQSR
jgi:hypothetical protein